MYNNIPLLVLEFQARSLYVQHLLQAEAAKEYDADWLPEAKKVLRDATGKFAKKGTTVDVSQQSPVQEVKQQIVNKYSQIQEQVQDTGSLIKQTVDVSTTAIQSLLKDEGFRKRAGLAAGLPMARMIDRLLKMLKLDPKLTGKLDQWIEESTSELQKAYGQDGNPAAQAMRKLPPLPPDASFKNKMEYRVALYAAYTSALKNPEKYSKLDEIVGKAAGAAVPVAISLAIALAPAIGIPAFQSLFLGESIVWGEILISSLLGEVFDAMAQKSLDEFNVQNPYVRIVAGMLSGVLAGSLLNSAKDLKRISSMSKEVKLAEESTEKFLKSKGIDYSQIFPDHKAIQKAKLTPTSSKSGINQTFATEIDGKKYFLKKTPLNRGVREKAAYEIAHALGIGEHFIPAKPVLIGKQSYVMQPFMEGFDNLREQGGNIHKTIGDKLDDFILFDHIADMKDRHYGNFMTDGKKVMLVDNELTFYRRVNVSSANNWKPQNPSLFDQMFGYKDSPVGLSFNNKLIEIAMFKKYPEIADKYTGLLSKLEGELLDAMNKKNFPLLFSKGRELQEAKGDFYEEVVEKIFNKRVEFNNLGTTKRLSEIDTKLAYGDIEDNLDELTKEKDELMKQVNAFDKTWGTSAKDHLIDETKVQKAIDASSQIEDILKANLNPLELDLVLSGFRARIGYLKRMLSDFETEGQGFSMNKLTYQGTYTVNP